MFSFLQVLCVILVVSGLSYEYVTDAGLGHLLITSGSLVFAISVKLKKWQMEKRWRV